MGPAARHDQELRHTTPGQYPDKLPTNSVETPESGTTIHDDEDLDDAASDSSNYSTISHDTLPPFHAHDHTYHGSRRLYTPNDASESHRFDLQHELFKLCLDGELVAAKLPLEPNRSAPAQSELGHAAGTEQHEFHILDVGAGNGVWAMEMAQRYPQATILGIDLSSSLLPSNVPPNLTFEIGDVAEPWPPGKLYDFIHVRNLVGGGVRDWAGFVKEVYAHLKPGGQMQLTEVTPNFFDADAVKGNGRGEGQGEVGGEQRSTVKATACVEYITQFVNLSRERGLNFDPLPYVTPTLSSLGAQELRERVDWVPVKSWAHADPVTMRKGALVEEILGMGMENWTMRLFGECGWEDGETRALLSRVMREVTDEKMRSVLKATFITARRPKQA